MSEVRTFFRFCPACGKRFHIRLVGKKLVGDREERSVVTEEMAPMAEYGLMSSPLLVEENVPITVDVEDFQYTYKCKHCGHVWTEMHEEEH